MKKLLLLLAVTLVGLTSCEERLDRLDEVNLQQNIQIDILRTDLNALTQSVNDEIARVEQIIAAVDAENDAALIEGLSAAQAELTAAVALLAQADTDNLVAALAAVSAAEETLAMVIANNLAATTVALEALGVVDADLLSRIEAVLSDIAALDAALSAEDVRLDEAIALANTLIEDANEAIQTNADNIELLRTELTDLIAASHTTLANAVTALASATAANDQTLASAIENAVSQLQSAITTVANVSYSSDQTLLEAINLLGAAHNALVDIVGGHADDIANLSDVVKQQIALMEADGFILDEGSTNRWTKTTSTGIRRVFLSSGGKFYPSVEVDGVVYDLGGRATFAGVLDAFLKFNIEAQRSAEITSALEAYLLPADQIAAIVSSTLSQLPEDNDVVITGVTLVDGVITITLSEGEPFTITLPNFVEDQIAAMEADGFSLIESGHAIPTGINGNESNLWLKKTSAGWRYVFKSSQNKFYAYVYDKDTEEVTSLGGRATFAGILDAFLKHNLGK